MLKEIWPVLFTASSQLKINPAHIISSFFPFIKKRAQRSNRGLSSFTNECVEHRGRRGRTERYRESLGTEFFFYFGTASQRLLSLPCRQCLQTAQCVPKESSEPWRHNSRLEDRQQKMFGNVIWCLEALTKKKREKKTILCSEELPRGLTSDLPLDCSLMAGNFINLTIFLALVGPVKGQTPPPQPPPPLPSISYSIQTTLVICNTWHSFFSTSLPLNVFIFRDWKHFSHLHTDWQACWYAGDGGGGNNPVLHIIMSIYFFQQIQKIGKICSVHIYEKMLFHQEVSVYELYDWCQGWFLYSVQQQQHEEIELYIHTHIYIYSFNQQWCCCFLFSYHSHYRSFFNNSDSFTELLEG